MDMFFGDPRASANSRFDEYYRCYSTAMLAGPQRDSVDYGGKVILPPSALDKLSRKNISYPMQFELRNRRKSAATHAGVLEFIAEEGRIYLPHWMMRTLGCAEGDLLQVLSTDLLQGTFVQLEPQSPEFLDITDPKAVLENTFRNFATLTKGDVFSFRYNDKVYDVAVLQVKPESEAMAIGVIETDLSVDFAPPKGYIEPERQGRKASLASAASGTAGGVFQQGTGAMARKIKYDALKEAGAHKQERFASAGHKLSGKPISIASGTATPVSSAAAPSNAAPGVPQPLRLPKGTLFFGYELRLPKDPDAKDEEAQQVKFSGQGQSIKESNRLAKQAAAGGGSKGGSTRPSTTTGSDAGEPIEID